MDKENAILVDNDTFDDLSFDYDEFDEIEDKLQSELEKELADLDLLKEEREKIGNPDKLGKVIMDEVWSQFGNQLGLDMTKETLIGKYDRQHPETYNDVSPKVLQDPKYKNANKAIKEQQQQGKLKDAYTGKKLNVGDKVNLDHVVPRKEIYDDRWRKLGNLSTGELANLPENLKPTNDSLNKSKGQKSVKDYTDEKKRAQREKDLKEQNERANKKIDESNMSEAQKKQQKAKNDKALNDKLNADNDLMNKADKKARNAINKKKVKAATKEVGKKAAGDALKQMAVAALFSLLKEVINGLVNFFKTKAKSFKAFLDEMKAAIKSFFGKISSVIQTGVSAAVGTVVTEVLDAVSKTFQKLVRFIKQGISSVIDAIRYLKDKENKNKPFSIKVAEVGKIITAALVAGGAIVLGEFFEKIIETNVPVLKIQLPMLGSLAGIIGMFLASLISGVIGAIIINFIDKYIAKRQKAELTIAQIKKGNEIINIQQKIGVVKEAKLAHEKTNVANEIKRRHEATADTMNSVLENIMSNCEDDESINDNLNNIDRMLDGLEGEI